MTTIDKMGNQLKSIPNPDKMGNLPKYSAETTYKGKGKDMSKNDKKKKAKEGEKLLV